MTFSLITVHMCMIWSCHSFVDGLYKNELMCIYIKCKKDKFINHDCLPILMLLYILLHIMLAYLMMSASLSNADCLYNAFFSFLCHRFLQMLFVSCFFLVY